MTLKQPLHRAFRRWGFDVVRFDGRKFHERKRAELMHTLGVDMVIDVGAHVGQYITELRANEFHGRIVAFEPQRGPFEELVRLAAKDPKLTAHRCALGAEDREGSMHVSATSYSSSLLPMHEAHLRLAPDSAFVSEERVQIRTLDSFDLLGPHDLPWLKIDTQGYEHFVLKGAVRTIAAVAAVEIELTYVTLYEDQSLAWELEAELRDRGFALATLGKPLYDPETLELFQIDGIFVRRS